MLTAARLARERTHSLHTGGKTFGTTFSPVNAACMHACMHALRISIRTYSSMHGSSAPPRPPPTCVTLCNHAMSFSYSVASKLVMPPLTVVVLCSSHHSIILSYARAASASWSKQPAAQRSDVHVHMQMQAWGEGPS